MAWPSLTSMDHHLITSKRTCFVALLFFFLLFNSAKAESLIGDTAALLVFKDNFTKAGILGSWSNQTSACRFWEGVGCKGNGSSKRVISLNLTGSDLNGSIHLETLWNLTALKYLILSNNSFSGPLPANFTAWPLMLTLDFSFNNFSGEIPASLNSSTNLTSLFLQNNDLSGSIPPLSIASLRNFSVANNHLNGSIPPSLSKFPAASFTGNNDLCGAPLSTSCSTGLPAPHSSSSKKLSAGAIVGIVIGVVAFAVVALLLCFLLLRRKSKKQGQAEGSKDMPANNNTGSESNEIGSVPQGLTFVGNAKQTFDLDGLLRASAEVLGKGSLGTAYKAVMDDGLVVSVKRLRELATERDKHIVEMLGALHHPNLVPLLAYFFAEKETLLVSDYMPNGSLSSLLHGNKGTTRAPLDWEARVDIAGAVARGLSYLHDEKVVHGNVKSSNVLLSRDGQARLIDYGLVQMAPEPSSNLKPNGYTPPEASADLRKITYKGDVYAFGVLLLELLTGKSPIALNQDGISLATWVQSNAREEEALDPHILKYDYIREEMIHLLHIALPCVSPSPDHRPPMTEIVKMIESLKKQEHDDSFDSYYDQYPDSAESSTQH